MENMTGAPTPEQAAAALSEAEAGRSRLAQRLELPSGFLASIGVAIAVQIACTALGLAGAGGLWLVSAGVLVFVAVAAVQLVRFRQRNGVRLGALASRVVAGTASAASACYGLAGGAAIWAAMDGRWWLVPPASAAGGLGYALSGQQWLRRYRAEPARLSHAESAAWLAVLGVLALAGLVGLVLGS